MVEKYPHLLRLSINLSPVKRRINQTDISTHVSSLSADSCAVTSYVCGPPDMIDSVSEWL